MHDEEFIRPYNLLESIEERVKEYKVAHIINNKIMSRSRIDKLIKWHCPQQDLIKLNLDEAHDQDKNSGCGGIIRNADGNWCGGFSKFVGNYSILMVELYGIFEGLKLVVERGYKKIVVEMDSQAAIDIIKQYTNNILRKCNLVRQILS